MGCHLDATSTVEVESAVERTLASLGRVDICVNNAGGLMGRVKVADMADAHWEGVLAVNLTTAFRCTRAVLPHLGEGGRIANISSLSAFNGGGQGYVAYATAKAAICGFTRSLAKEVAPRRITVNAVAPGFVPGTPFHDQFTPPDLQETIIRSIPLGRGTPEDVSSAVMWLCSPGASWVTGATIPVNGGHYFS